MKNLVILLFFILISCDAAKKTAQIVEFTPSLADVKQNRTDQEVDIISTGQKIHSWNDAVNIVNHGYQNITINDLNFKNFQKHNLKIKGFAPLISKVILAEDSFILLDGKANLYSFDVGNLRKKWEINLTDNFKNKKYHAGSIVYQKDMLYVSYGGDEVLAIDASSGSIKWRKSVLDVVKSHIAVGEDYLYFLGLSDKLYVLNKTDGTVLDQKFDSEEWVYQGHEFGPLLSGNKIYVPFFSGVLRAYDIENMREIWSNDFAEDLIYDPALSPLNFKIQSIIEDDRLYTASPENNLLKLNTEDGSVVWRSDIKDIKSMNHSCNYLFVTTNARELIAVEKKSGKIGWVTKLYDEKSTNNLKVLSYSTPLMINSKLHITNSVGSLFIISPKTGVIENHIKIPKSYLSSMVIGDKYYIFSNDGVLYHN